MKKEIIRVEPLATWLERYNAPTSTVTRHGNMIFVTGAPPHDPATGEIFRGPIEKQTEYVLQQMQMCVEAAGGKMEDDGIPPPEAEVDVLAHVRQTHRAMRSLRSYGKSASCGLFELFEKIGFSQQISIGGLRRTCFLCHASSFPSTSACRLVLKAMKTAGMAPPQIKAATNLDTFIGRWAKGDGGQEHANYALFLAELCDVLDVPRPDQASHDAFYNAYAIERAVTFREPDVSTARKRIDLYKRGSFVLEGKQSRRPGATKAIPDQGDLLATEEVEATPRGRRAASRTWDVPMLNARQQAEDYAKALPASEGWPPFLIVCGVGHFVCASAESDGAASCLKS